MSIKTNLDALTLLGNELIKIYFEDKIIEFRAPTIRLLLMDKDFELFVLALRQTPASLKELMENNLFIVNNNYETFLSLLKTESSAKDIILDFFYMTFPNLTYKNSQLYCGEVPLSPNEYDIILNAFWVSCGEKELKTFFNEEKKLDTQLTERQKKQQELEEKIKKSKEKKKTKETKNENKSSTSTITIEQIVIAILYEFKGLKIDDIYNMNMFAVLELWKYVSKIVDNQIQIIAAGNGNIKKFTYFIN